MRQVKRVPEDPELFEQLLLTRAVAVIAGQPHARLSRTDRSPSCFPRELLEPFGLLSLSGGNTAPPEGIPRRKVPSGVAQKERNLPWTSRT
jgi:hypothetical protein